MRAILSAVDIGAHRCDLVAYFRRSWSPDPIVVREWGTRRARIATSRGWRWITAPDPDPPVAHDLTPWLRSGQLQWIAPHDTGVTLRTGTDGCPWLA